MLPQRDVCTQSSVFVAMGIQEVFLDLMTPLQIL